MELASSEFGLQNELPKYELLALVRLARRQRQPVHYSNFRCLDALMSKFQAEYTKTAEIRFCRHLTASRLKKYGQEAVSGLRRIDVPYPHHITNHVGAWSINPFGIFLEKVCLNSVAIGCCARLYTRTGFFRKPFRFLYSEFRRFYVRIKDKIWGISGTPLIRTRNLIKRSNLPFVYLCWRTQLKEDFVIGAYNINLT